MQHYKKFFLIGIILLLSGVMILLLISGTDPFVVARPMNSSSSVLLSQPEGFLAHPEQTASQNLNIANVSQAVTSVDTLVKPSEQVLNTTQSTSVPLTHQPVLIQQRDQLYKNFADISNALSQGQQPDFRQVSDLLVQQQQLVKTGVLSIEEAISYSQFLRQILPAMDQQLQQHIQQLEQQKHH